MNTQNFAIYIHLDTKNKKLNLNCPLTLSLKIHYIATFFLSSFQKEELTTVNV